MPALPLCAPDQWPQARGLGSEPLAARAAAGKRSAPQPPFSPLCSWPHLRSSSSTSSAVSRMISAVLHDARHDRLSASCVLWICVCMHNGCARLGRARGSWLQHLVISRRRGSGQSGSTHGRSWLMATCRRRLVCEEDTRSVKRVHRHVPAHAHPQDDLEEVAGVTPWLAACVALVEDDAQSVHIHLQACTQCRRQ